VECKNQNSDFEFHRASKFLEAVEVTIWAANFDRYIYVLKIMVFREKCMASLTKILFKTQSREMYEAESAS
jgi:hypothetical protein